MKNSVLSYVLSGAAGALLVLAVLGIYSFTSADSVDLNGFKSMQKVESFDIADSISFAGENIDLTRYDIRERFDREIIAISYQHSYTMLSIKRANKYFPIIEPMLEKYGIPSDFKFLALVESNFNTRAISPVKAAGFWQLMPDTAKELGLEVNDEVDERFDVEKSTEAACKYLLKAYERFGDWVLVAASYNAGMGRIRGELRKQQVDKFSDLWLNEETSRYVFRILASKAFMKRPQHYGYYIKKDQFYPSISYDTITVSESIPDLAVFAKENGIPYVMLKESNPWLRDRQLLNAQKNTYKIAVPKKTDLQKITADLGMYQENWAVD